MTSADVLKFNELTVYKKHGMGPILPTFCQRLKKKRFSESISDYYASHQDLYLLST